MGGRPQKPMKEKYGQKYIVKLMPDVDGFPQEDKTEYIPCGRRDGLDHIYEISCETLGLWLTGSQKIRRIRKEVRGLVMLQDGENEAVLGFPPELLDRVAKIAKARKRRYLSPERRAKTVEILKQARQAKGL